MTSSSSIAVLASALALGGCGSSDSGDNGASGGTGPASGEQVGNFGVELVAANPTTGTDAFTSMNGFVRNAPLNAQVVWDLADESGDCRLYTPRAPFCEPACATGSTCVEDGVCAENPTAHSVGTVTVFGLQTADGAAEFSIEPLAPLNNYQPAASIDILFPPCDEGAPVRVVASGADYAGFEIESAGIAPLEVLGADPLPMAPDQPLALQWTAAGTSSVSRIEVEVDISHHGGARGKIECDLDDTGNYDVPATLVTQLIDLGVAGFPTALLTRRARGSTGTVDLDVFMSVERPLEIPGLVSCTSDADCEAGQTCQSDRACG